MNEISLSQGLKFRWLGAAGMEFFDGDKTILVDPFFTRPRMAKNFFVRVKPDKVLVQKWIKACDAIFVTHAHYDHVLDVPLVNQLTHAPVYASRNVNRLIQVGGVPDAQNLNISVGDEITVGKFKVTILKGTHGVTPLDFILNRPIPQNIRYPLRLTDYRLDGCFAFHIEWEGMSILIGESPVRADLAFVYPLRDPKQYLWYLPQAAPQVVIPIHWDDFFQPLNHTIRTLPFPKLGFPPKVRRIKIDQFCSGLEAEMDDVKTVIPEPFQWMAAGIKDGVITIN